MGLPSRAPTGVPSQAPAIATAATGVASQTLAVAQVALVQPTQGKQSCAQRKFRRAYSISFSSPSRPQLKKPADFSKQEFAILLKKRHTQMFVETAAKEGLAATDQNTIHKVMVWDELHADGEMHKYCMVLADRPYSCEPVRALLAKEDKVHIMFGTSHSYWWTGVVYGSVPSVHKALEEIDAQPYHSEGLTVREELMDMAKGARVADKERVRAFLGVPAGSAKPQAQSRLGKEELGELIQSNGWRTRASICAAARAEKSDNPTFYNTLLHMGPKELEDLMSWVWELEGVDLHEEPVEDRLAKLCHTAANGTCSCGGRWIPAAERMMELQGLDSKDFRRIVVRALKHGRRKGYNVLIVGSPNGGKSFTFKVLAKIFKTFKTSEMDNFPLQGIHGMEVAVLQDVRFESFGLHWDGWLRWAEGEDVKVKLPRNHFKESMEYNGMAPIFATMASPFEYPLSEARKTGRNVEYENGQFRSRFTTVTYRTPIPVEERDSTLDPCERCGAEWYAGVVDESAPASNEEEPADDDILKAIRAAELAQDAAHKGASEAAADDDADDCDDDHLMQALLLAEASRDCGAAGAVHSQALSEAVSNSPAQKRARTEAASPPTAPSAADVLFQRLQTLTDLRKARLLDTPEYKAAKCELLGIP